MLSIIWSKGNLDGNTSLLRLNYKFIAHGVKRKSFQILDVLYVVSIDGNTYKLWILTKIQRDFINLMNGVTALNFLWEGLVNQAKTCRSKFKLLVLQIKQLLRTFSALFASFTTINKIKLLLYNAIIDSASIASRDIFNKRLFKLMWLKSHAYKVVIARSSLICKRLRKFLGSRWLISIWSLERIISSILTKIWDGAPGQIAVDLWNYLENEAIRLSANVGNNFASNVDSLGILTENVGMFWIKNTSSM